MPQNTSIPEEKMDFKLFQEDAFNQVTYLCACPETPN
jgi:hypothetical protein